MLTAISGDVSIFALWYITYTWNRNPVSDSKADCEFFLAHYLYFCLLWNQYTFLNTSCIFTKVIENRCEISGNRIIEENCIHKQNALRSIGHIAYPLFIWFMQYNHYYYWFTSSMLLMVIAAMSSQVTYLLNVIGEGKFYFTFFYQQI